MEGPPDVLTIEDFPELLEPVDEDEENERYESLRREVYYDSFRQVGSLLLKFGYQTVWGYVFKKSYGASL